MTNPLDELINGLAELVGLRDRELLGHAMVHLVHRFLPERAGSVCLIRLVSEGEDLMCLEAARCEASGDLPRFEDLNDKRTAPAGQRLSPAAQTTVHSTVQSAMQRNGPVLVAQGLTPLTNFPLRVQCHAQGNSVLQGTGPCTLVIGLGASVPPQRFLELNTPFALDAQLVKRIEGIARIYQSFEGLLDYGEKDALTDLLNRKTFDGAFIKASAQLVSVAAFAAVDRRAQRVAQGYWLAVLDIDHFKRVNDNFGHLIGDEVLLLMARLMRTSFRYHDQLYRFGGEEFVILMRCDSPADASGALERFRAAVQGYVFPQVGGITVSIGFTALREDDTPTSAFDRADKAVYYAKGHGRNQVCSYQVLLEQGELTEESSDSNDIDFF